MTRQTSIQVTEQTERQAKALEAAGFGTGFTNIVRLAVDRMYMREVGTMTIETILYQYDSDESAMFGPDEQPGVDIQASYNAFEDAISGALLNAYPMAEVYVQSGPHMIRVNHSGDHAEVPAIEDIVHEVWEGFDWVVNK